MIRLTTNDLFIELQVLLKELSHDREQDERFGWHYQKLAEKIDIRIRDEINLSIKDIDNFRSLLKEVAKKEENGS